MKGGGGQGIEKNGFLYRELFLTINIDFEATGIKKFQKASKC